MKQTIDVGDVRRAYPDWLEREQAEMLAAAGFVHHPICGGLLASRRLRRIAIESAVRWGTDDDLERFVNAPPGAGVEVEWLATAYLTPEFRAFVLRTLGWPAP